MSHGELFEDWFEICEEHHIECDDPSCTLCREWEKFHREWKPEEVRA